MSYVYETGLVRYHASIRSGLVTQEEHDRIAEIAGHKSGAVTDIRRGRVSVEVAAGGYEDVPLSFEPAFSRAPYVLAACETRARASTTSTAGYALSASSGGIRIYNSHSSAQTIAVNWAAIV